jgi:hypothetical protein
VILPVLQRRMSISFAILYSDTDEEADNSKPLFTLYKAMACIED